jgi:hypothetical protein
MSMNDCEKFVSKCLEMSSNNCGIVLTAHCTMFAFKGLVKCRRHAAVCDECRLSVNTIIQSWYKWNLGNSVAVQLKKLKSLHLSQAFRCHSSEGIITETQISEVFKLFNLSRNRSL